MIIGKKTATGVEEYKEESVKPAIAVAIVAVLLVALPLGYVIYQISDAGVRASDISRYNDLAQRLDKNVASIQGLLKQGAISDNDLSGVSAAPVVTLITPDISPSNLGESTQNGNNALNVKLKAIYWNPSDPLVTIDDDNYRIGDRVKGYKIKEIRKTEVVFMSPMGETVIKYFYDYLDTP